MRSDPAVRHPDMYIQFLPGAIRYDGKAAAPMHGFQAHVGPMRSPSRGAVTLRSGEAKDAPVIRFNYMSHEEDWRDFRRAVRITREVFGQKPSTRSGARKSSQEAISRAMQRSTASSANTPRAPTIPAAPAVWAAPTIPMPWSTRKPG